MAAAVKKQARPVRLNREEAKRRTHERLLTAAREVFLERGFHGASVAEIAERAGYTTGALYSNFGGKDDLFLAVLDVELAERAGSQRGAMEGRSLEQVIRAAARDLHSAGARDPAMTPLIVEFWTYAADKPKLREQASALHERQIEWIAELLRESGERHGVQFRISAEDAARGGGALSRGARLERLLDPSSITERTFEEMFTAYVMGLVVSGDGRNGSRKSKKGGK
jgi:AcrR family transcriptional regulator